jgi:hypothetical protein
VHASYLTSTGPAVSRRCSVAGKLRTSTTSLSGMSATSSRLSFARHPADRETAAGHGEYSGKSVTRVNTPTFGHGSGEQRKSTRSSSQNSRITNSVASCLELARCGASRDSTNLHASCRMLPSQPRLRGAPRRSGQPRGTSATSQLLRPRSMATYLLPRRRSRRTPSF